METVTIGVSEFAPFVLVVSDRIQLSEICYTSVDIGYLVRNFALGPLIRRQH
jgi:hypothetical protein